MATEPPSAESDILERLARSPRELIAGGEPDLALISAVNAVCASRPGTPDFTNALVDLFVAAEFVQPGTNLALHVAAREVARRSHPVLNEYPRHWAEPRTSVAERVGAILAGQWVDAAELGAFHDEVALTVLHGVDRLDPDPRVRAKALNHAGQRYVERQRTDTWPGSTVWAEMAVDCFTAAADLYMATGDGIAAAMACGRINEVRSEFGLPAPGVGHSL